MAHRGSVSPAGKSSCLRDVDNDVKSERARDYEELAGELDEELRAQPLLDSVRSLVNKERELASIQFEEKEREAELWKNKFLRLQTTARNLGRATERREAEAADELSASTERRLAGADDDWDNLQAARRNAGDSCLRQLRKRESLDLSGRGIGAKDLDGVLVKLRWLKRFTSVNLSGNKIDDACAPALRNLMSLGQLRYLDLRGNEIGVSAGVSVFESLVRCTGLQVLRLEANMAFARTPGMGTRVASCLRAARKGGACMHLRSLSLTADDFDRGFLNASRTNGIPARRKVANLPRSKEVKAEGEGSITGRDSSARTGCRAASAPWPIAPPHPMNALAVARSFHLRAAAAPSGAVGANPCREEGNNSEVVDRLGGKGHGTITSFGLPYARLHPRTVGEIAIHAIASLMHLDLSFCYIGPAGARALARALGKGGRGSRSLRRLRLPHNAIGDAGACTLGRALAGNHRLTYLDLTSNGIGSTGGSALASLFRNDGVVLSRLDVGDNPLGRESAQLLVVAAADATASSTQRTGTATTTVAILGLDKVLGASVATREAARRTAAAGQKLEAKAGVGPEAGWDSASLSICGGSLGPDQQEASCVLSVPDKVRVIPGATTVRDGFIQAYEFQLDFGFQSSSDGVNQSRGGGGQDGWRNITIEIRWRFGAAATLNSANRGGVLTPVDNGFCCPFRWRVSRTRNGDTEFSVKEGLAGLRMSISTSDSDGDDDYSPARVVCNGWRQGDVLKIFVRPSSRGYSHLSCCDLSIRMLRGTEAGAYGLLWVDRDNSTGGDREGNDPRLPSAAERARVALQMHNPLPPRWIDSDHTHRLRKVRLPSGGRIQASWRMGLEVESRHCHGKDQDGGRRPCGYAWAIVRQRGAVVDDDDDGAMGCGCGVTMTTPSSSLYTPPSARVISRGGASASSSSRSYYYVNDDLQYPLPVRWQSFEAETTGWLPGDLLSLWIQVDPDHNPDFNPDPNLYHCSRSAAANDAVGVEGRTEGWPIASARKDASERGSGECGGGAEVEAAQVREGRPPVGTEGWSRRCYRRRPRVRGFEIRVVDDAGEERIAGRVRSRVVGQRLREAHARDHEHARQIFYY